jgi:hypothetical protein
VENCTEIVDPAATEFPLGAVETTVRAAGGAATVADAVVVRS